MTCWYRFGQFFTHGFGLPPEKTSLYLTPTPLIILGCCTFKHTIQQISINVTNGLFCFFFNRWIEVGGYLLMRVHFGWAPVRLDIAPPVSPQRSSVCHMSGTACDKQSSHRWVEGRTRTSRNLQQESDTLGPSFGIGPVPLYSSWWSVCKPESDTWVSSVWLKQTGDGA